MRTAQPVRTARRSSGTGETPTERRRRGQIPASAAFLRPGAVIGRPPRGSPQGPFLAVSSLSRAPCGPCLSPVLAAFWPFRARKIAIKHTKSANIIRKCAYLDKFLEFFKPPPCVTSFDMVLCSRRWSMEVRRHPVKPNRGIQNRFARLVKVCAPVRTSNPSRGGRSHGS